VSVPAKGILIRIKIRGDDMKLKLMMASGKSITQKQNELLNYAEKHFINNISLSEIEEWVKNSIIGNLQTAFIYRED